MSYIDDKTLLLVNNDEDNIIKPSLKETNLICYYDGRDTLTNSTITDRSNNSNNYTVTCSYNITCLRFNSLIIHNK